VIHLADYTPTTLKFLKTHDLAAVYVFSTEGDRPCKIGHCLSLPRRFASAQAEHYKALHVEHAVWTPSAATAALIVEDVRHKLGDRAMNGGWFYVGVDDAVAAVRRACRVFPSQRLVEHGTLMAQLAKSSGAPLAQITRSA
jgi:hypothetical protein